MIQYRKQQVTVFQSALYQTTSTVLETNNLVLLVDPCWLAEEVSAIQAHVQQIRGDRPLYLLFTHGDFDHIIGDQAFPDAIRIGSRGLHEHPHKTEKVEMIEQFDSKNYIARNYPIVFPTLEVIVDADGQQLRVGDTTLTFYLAPGHSQDGLFTIVEELGVWIAGDYLSNLEFPFIYHDSDQYEETMRKVEPILEKHDIRLLIPGHGQATADASEIRKRTRDSLDYIRRLREAILADDQHTIDHLTDGYPFAKGQQQFHKDNIALMKKELENKSDQ